MSRLYLHIMLTEVKLRLLLGENYNAFVKGILRG
jgi:hypothetical protein